MKTTSSEIVYKSKLLYTELYTYIEAIASNDVCKKILEKHRDVVLLNTQMLFSIIGCYAGAVPVNKQFDMVFEAGDIDRHVYSKSIIRKAFALGLRSFEEVPERWAVTALIEFPNGIPSILLDANNKGFYLSSEKMWQNLMNL